MYVQNVCIYVCMYFDDLLNVKVDRPRGYLTWTDHQITGDWSNGSQLSHVVKELF